MKDKWEIAWMIYIAIGLGFLVILAAQHHLREFLGLKEKELQLT